MPGAAQCGSSPRRRFRDTEPIINQRDADRQRSDTRSRHGARLAVAAPSAMPDGPAERVGSDGRTAAILPASARVGLLTDCKGSSDEITQRNLPCRRSGIGAQIADCCSNLSESGQPGATAHILDEQVDEIACEARQRIGIDDADRQLTLGPVALERDEAQRHRLRTTARGAFGQHAGIRVDHPAGRLEVADLDAPAQHALHVGGRSRVSGRRGSCSLRAGR